MFFQISERWKREESMLPSSFRGRTGRIQGLFPFSFENNAGRMQGGIFGKIIMGRSVRSQGECILEKNARKSMEGGEKKRVSHMRMNPCRRNAGEVRVRRKRVGRVERESLDFLQKMCRFPLQ